MYYEIQSKGQTATKLSQIQIAEAAFLSYQMISKANKKAVTYILLSRSEDNDLEVSGHCI